MTILVFGANGQVGSALLSQLGEKATGITRAECDLADVKAVRATLEKHAPEAIINAAAYTAVDKAEQEEALATAINAEAPAIMAQYAKEKDIPFIHYSTDYVFPGTGNKPWKETDATGPLNAYGRSKLAGEEKIKAIGGRYFIFRTSWVYDAHGKNFLNTMLRLGEERETLNVVSDQFGAPSHAPDIAAATIHILEVIITLPETPAGIYNLCNDGMTSWRGFAEAIFDEAKRFSLPVKVRKVHPIATDEFPTPAARPQNSRLDLSKTRKTFRLKMPDWRESLRGCLHHKAHCGGHH